MFLCFLFFFLVSTVFVNCLFIERLFLTPDTHSFIVQEHRKVTNFHGTQPKKFFILQITLHFEKYQPPSSPQNLSWNHNFCRNLHMPSFFVQPQKTYRKLQTPGRLWTLQQYEIADVSAIGQEATRLRFCQSSGHGSSPSRRLNRNVLLGWWRNGLWCSFEAYIISSPWKPAFN